MMPFFFYLIGLSLGSMSAKDKAERYYTKALNELYDKNCKYKLFIIQKNLLEDWHNFNIKISNNDEQPSKPID